MQVRVRLLEVCLKVEAFGDVCHLAQDSIALWTRSCSSQILVENYEGVRVGILNTCRYAAAALEKLGKTEEAMLYTNEAGYLESIY